MKSEVVLKRNWNAHSESRKRSQNIAQMSRPHQNNCSEFDVVFQHVADILWQRNLLLHICPCRMNILDHIRDSNYV